MSATKSKAKKANKVQKKATQQPKASARVPAGPASPGPSPQVLQGGDLSPGLLLQLQRSHGNAFVRRLMDKRSNGSSLRPSTQNGQAAGPGQIQRSVFSSATWQKKSSRFGRMRSTKLIEIDMALAAYHKSHRLSPADQLGALTRVQAAISEWGDTKQGKGVHNSRRAKTVTELESSIYAEKHKLRQKIGPAVDPNTSAGAIAKARQLFKRAEAQTRAVAATNNSKQAAAPLASLNSLAAEIRALATQAGLLGATVPEQNAKAMTSAVRSAIMALRMYAMGYLDRNAVSQSALSHRKSVATSFLNHLPTIEARMQIAQGGVTAQQDKSFVVEMVNRIAKFEGFLVPDKLSGGDLDWIDELLDMSDTGTSMLGYQGTDGKGNEGLNEMYKDSDSGLKGGVKNAFTGLTPKVDSSKPDQAAEEQRVAQEKDKISGGSDMANALVGMGGDIKGLIEAIKVLKKARKAKRRNKPEDMPEKDDILAAKFTLAKFGPSTVATVMQFTGGALTAHRGGGNTLGSSNFGFTNAGGNDTSTDSKMAGDFGGLLAGIIGSIEKVVDLVKFIKKGGATDAKSKRRSDRGKWTERRKDLEGVGILLSKYTSTVASFAGNTKSLIKLGYQISGGGQIADSVVGGTTGLANLGGVVPVLGLINSVIGAVRNGYKLARMGIRRTDLATKIGTLRDVAEFATVSALEFTRESLDKRIKRILINLAHDLTNITAGGLNLSGIGTAPGMVIGLSSSALKLGQIGLRKAKQAARERTAKKRAKKGKEVTYGDWKDQKRLAASGSRREAAMNWIRTAVKPNWDKTAANKEERNRGVAMELLELKDPDVFKSLGVWEKLEDEPDNYQKRLEIVVGALTKRD